MKVQPLHDRLIVKRVDSQEMSKGGIIIPDTAKEKPVEGIVVAVGPGKTMDNGQTKGLTVSEGDKVLLSKYAGTEIKIAGERTFDDWTVQVLNDTDFAVRDAMERWMNGINGHSANTGLTNPIDYQADLIVEQLDRDGSILKRYDFRGAFPTTCGPIELSYDTVGEVEVFDVTFTYQYWESNTTS